MVVHFDSVTIDSVSRTPILADFECTVVTVRNADIVNDATLYDAASGGSGITLAAGQSRAFRPQVGSRQVSWRAGDTVVWAQAASGTGPIEVELLQ